MVKSDKAFETLSRTYALCPEQLTQRNMRDDVGGSKFLFLSGFLLGSLLPLLLAAAAGSGTAARIILEKYG
jgi:hypothetical protein